MGLSYSQSSSQHFRLDLGPPVDGSEYPDLVLDREERATQCLVLTAHCSPARSVDSQATVIVQDTNDNEPGFERPVYLTRVSETTHNGDRVIPSSGLGPQ